jgi:hypothetical protein
LLALAEPTITEPENDGFGYDDLLLKLKRWREEHITQLLRDSRASFNPGSSRDAHSFLSRSYSFKIPPPPPPKKAKSTAKFVLPQKQQDDTATGSSAVGSRFSGCHGF